MFHTVQLSKSDPTPLYIQLASELAKLIQMGLLSSGTKLPAIRFLSSQLAINRDTVVSAYKLLEQQGLVEGHIGKGTYVLPLSNGTILPTPTTQTTHPIYCNQLGFSKDLFPPSLCMSLTKEIIQTDGWDAFSDPLYRERHSLKQNVVQFLNYLGVHPNFAQVRIIKDLQDFYLSLFKFNAKPGICVESPRDLSTTCYLESIGAQIYEVPLTQDGMDLDALEHCLKTDHISYILLSDILQNPTGLCYSLENKQAIFELAKQYHCYIIEDGTYSEFIYDHTPQQPLWEQFSNEHIIYMYHFSKLYLPHLKYSFAILPSRLAKTIIDKTECTFHERLLDHYLTSDFLHNIRSTLYETSKEKYMMLMNSLAYSKDYSILHQHGGLSIWLKSLNYPIQELCAYLGHEQIIVSPSSLFTNKLITEPYIRLAISKLSCDEVNFVLDALLNFYIE